MAKGNPKRHLTVGEVRLAADWVLNQGAVPSWDEVRRFVLREFGVDRVVEALRRVPELKAARDARAAAPARRPVRTPRPTARRLDALESEIQRLGAEVCRLEAENAALFERNLRLVNGARVRQIPERELDRELTPVNRSPTRLPTRTGAR
jgi:hypothetical protein